MNSCLQSKCIKALLHGAVMRVFLSAGGPVMLTDFSHLYTYCYITSKEIQRAHFDDLFV